MNFIKKIFSGKADDSVHKQFIRFGKGEYRGRAVLGFWKTKSIKVRSSFEFANDFVLFAASLGAVAGNIFFDGNIWSKEQIKSMPAPGIKKEGKWIYNVSNFSGDLVKKIAAEVYCFLLNADGSGIKLRIKSKLPKPGKGEDKIDEKFCQLEIDTKYYNSVKEDFFWDLPECKKASIEHTFVIEDIMAPKGETDYAKIREMAKRKGRIIRIANVDGREIRKETEFEA